MYIGNPNKIYMEVYNGEKWIKEVMSIALSNIVDTKRILIGSIFNRFRFFLSNKATKLIPNAYYYGFRENYFFHKKIVQHIKIHLNNNKNNEKTSNEDIPTDRNHEVFWALSKKFNWQEVEKLITTMDELNIDLDKDLSRIKQQIITIIDEKPKLKKIFKKLIKRIDYLINNFKKNDNDSSSSSNESSSSSNELKTNTDESNTNLCKSISSSDDSKYSSNESCDDSSY